MDADPGISGVSKDQNEYVFLPNSPMIETFRLFLEELEDSKKSFRN